MTRCQACPPRSGVDAPWNVVWTHPVFGITGFAVCAKHAAMALASGATIAPAEQEI